MFVDAGWCSCVCEGDGFVDNCKEASSFVVVAVSAECCVVRYVWSFVALGEFCFLDCDDVCIDVVREVFQFFEFVADAVDVDL